MPKARRQPGTVGAEYQPVGVASQEGQPKVWAPADGVEAAARRQVGTT